jgi:hypothetical protein
MYTNALRPACLQSRLESSKMDQDSTLVLGLLNYTNGGFSRFRKFLVRYSIFGLLACVHITVKLSILFCLNRPLPFLLCFPHRHLASFHLPPSLTLDLSWLLDRTFLYTHIIPSVASARMLSTRPATPFRTSYPAATPHNYLLTRLISLPSSIASSPVLDAKKEELALDENNSKWK